MGKLDGRVAVITGGGRGIGRAMAARFAVEGATVVVASRTAADLESVVADIRSAGGTAACVVADMSERRDARRPVEYALEEFGAADVLVNNVGGTVGRRQDPFTTGVDDTTFEDTLALNLTSAWWASCAALPSMRERGWGRIINIGSGASKHAAGSLGYTTAKHALIGLTKQLAVTVGQLGITVNCLCPGWTNTSLIDWQAIARSGGTTPEVAREKAARENAQHRVLEPEELTPLAVLLASDEGAGITGQVLSVDGGYRL